MTITTMFKVMSRLSNPVSLKQFDAPLLDVFHWVVCVVSVVGLFVFVIPFCDVGFWGSFVCVGLFVCGVFLVVSLVVVGLVVVVG